MKCNMDCFNCELPDCTNDGLTTDDFRRSEKHDKLAGATSKELYHRRKSKEYHIKHRAERNAKQRTYYQENRVAEKERVAKWVNENRERRRQYLRERYQRKKTERAS